MAHEVNDFKKEYSQKGIEQIYKKMLQASQLPDSLYPFFRQHWNKIHPLVLQKKRNRVG